MPSDGSYTIELAGAANVTVSALSLTGGVAGIYAADGAGSTGLTVHGVDLYGDQYGIDLETSNDGPNIVASTVHGSSEDGIHIAAANAYITGNTLYANVGNGVLTAGPHPVIVNNTFHDNQNGGIAVDRGAGGLVSRNEVYANGQGSSSSAIGASTLFVPATGEDRLVVIDNDVRNNDAKWNHGHRRRSYKSCNRYDHHW